MLGPWNEINLGFGGTHSVHLQGSPPLHKDQIDLFINIFLMPTHLTKKKAAYII
jgi:hypothetical protein